VSCQAHRLANALAEKGHVCTVFSFSPVPVDARYEVRRLTRTRAGAVARKFQAARAFQRVDTAPFDIAHFHGDDYLTRGGPNRVRTFYGSALYEAIHARTFTRRAYQALFYLFEWISCLRRGEKVGISRATGCALPLVRRVIPCGVPVDKFTPGECKTPQPSLLFLGDLNSRKNGAFLLRIFTREIRAAFPECTLTVAGPRPCGGPNVRYAGVPGEQELVAEYRRAWVFCMTSTYEGFGVPVIEAMACGTAVVALRNAGTAAVVNHRHNGMLVKREGFAAAVCEVLSDGSLRQSLEQNGRRCVEQDYAMDRVAWQYEQVYASIPGRHAARH
jgi:glycosyltransferase involved in cell wall biosynthesis